jgi:hypothetical protein
MINVNGFARGYSKATIRKRFIDWRYIEGIVNYLFSLF